MIQPQQNIYEIIKDFDDIIIVGHVKPDGDAVGAALGTALCLERMGKKPKVLLQAYDSKFLVIPGTQWIFKGDMRSLAPEVFISVDCGSVDRFAPGVQPLFEKAKVTINIDHHVSNVGFAQHNFLDAGGSSTSQMIFTIFNNLVLIDREIATAIYAGMVYDTGGFRFQCTGKETMDIAGTLMETGIDYPHIYKEMILKRTMNEIKAYKVAINNIVMDNAHHIVFSSVTQSELKENQLTIQDLDSVVQFINCIEDIQVAVFMYETGEDYFKVSLRSVSLDVNAVAAHFGGGGHKNAAGCFVSGTKMTVLHQIQNELVSELSK